MSGRALPLADTYGPGALGCTRTWKAGEAPPGPATTDAALCPAPVAITAPPSASAGGGVGGGGGSGSNANGDKGGGGTGTTPPPNVPPGNYDGKRPPGVPDSVWQWEAQIQDACKKYNVSPDLARAMLQTESGGNANARSGAGAQGLMQLMPGTARGLGCTDPYNPSQNIEAGVKYISQLQRQFPGNDALVIAAYNAGPGNVRKYHGTIPPFTETQNHVKRVMAHMRRYRGA